MSKSKLLDKPSGTYRVIHSADWHLGKLLVDLSREEEHERFLSFLLKLIQDEEVDALVIAGDIFDSSNPPQSALARYYNFLSELYRTTTCSVVVIAGNHDSPAQLEAPREVLNTLRVRVLGAMPDNGADVLVTLPEEGEPQLIVAAVPFLRDRDVRTGQSGQTAAEIQKDLVAGIRKRYEDAAQAAQDLNLKVPVLATGHLTVAGSFTSESEREIHVGGLGAVGADLFPDSFSYVALGHLHRPQAAGGREMVRYSGSPIPLSFSEAGDAKEMRRLDFANGELIQSLPVSIPMYRHLVQLNCKRGELEEKMRSFRAPVAEFPTWVEVMVADPVFGENLFEIVQDYAKSEDYVVIRVAGKRVSGLQGLSEGAEPGEDIESSILDNPKEVFKVRLEREDGLSEAEKVAVVTVFDELINLYDEGNRGEDLELTQAVEEKDEQK